jgi:hypothetical protein
MLSFHGATQAHFRGIYLLISPPMAHTLERLTNAGRRPPTRKIPHCILGDKPGGLQKRYRIPPTVPELDYKVLKQLPVR